MSMDLSVSTSPLEIEHYFFPEIMFQAFSQKKRKKRIPPPLSETSFSCSPVDESGRFQVFLELSSKEDEKKELYYYRFKLASVGVFRWNAEFPQDEEEKKKLEERLAITGASILYSGLRNMLQTITGVGPYVPPYILPPITFLPQMKRGSPQVQQPVEPKQE